MPSFRSRISHAAKAFLTPVSTAAERRNMPMPFEVLYQSIGMPPLFKPGESLHAYGDNPWLAGAVDKIARELARTKFHLQTTNAKGEIEVIKKHQALVTLNRPQPMGDNKSMLTGFDLKLVTGYHLCLDGEAFWLLDKRLKMGRAPTNIDLLLPELMYPRIMNGELVEYTYRLPERIVHIDPKDVVHFKLPDPRKWQRGQPPTQAIRYALDTHKESDVFNLSKIKNGGSSGTNLETDQLVPPTERARILAEWDQRHRGAENAHRTAMLPNGLHATNSNESNQEMQFQEGKQANMKEILARYGVGPEILGLTESQTRSNAEAAIFIFMKFGASFFIEKFADTLNNQFSSEFSGLEDATWAYPDPVPENMEEKRANAETLASVGGATPNEIRKMFGLEPLALPGMDVPYMDMNKMPVGAPEPIPAAA
jgi:HK97 family phage portal protein